MWAKSIFKMFCVFGLIREGRVEGASMWPWYFFYSNEKVEHTVENMYLDNFDCALCTICTEEILEHLYMHAPLLEAPSWALPIFTSHKFVLKILSSGIVQSPVQHPILHGLLHSFMLVHLGGKESQSAS